MRLRAEDVEANQAAGPGMRTALVAQAKQREEQDTRMERGYAALQRVQQRGMQDG